MRETESSGLYVVNQDQEKNNDRDKHRVPKKPVVDIKIGFGMIRDKTNEPML